MRVGGGGRRQQGWIFRERRVRAVSLPEPELVLTFLCPPHRSARAAHVEPEIVLVPGAHLADVDRTLRAAVEAHEDGREILRPYREGLSCTDRAFRRERLRRLRGP